MEDKFVFKKKYGQNFLKDQNTIARIANIVGLTKEDFVIEVGPGAGSLTKDLEKKKKNVLCYEIDKTLEKILTENLKSYNNISILYQDFLKADLKADSKNYHYKNLYFVSNVPYYITTPILFKLISSSLYFQKIVMMVQKEVGDRFCASKGKKEYGALTVLLNYYFDTKKEFFVSRNQFYPIPKVDSVVVSFTPKENRENLKNEAFFIKLVHDSFQFKRKTIRNNLKNYNLEKVESVLKKYHYDLSTRAENIEYNVFVDLANSLYE